MSSALINRSGSEAIYSQISRCLESEIKSLYQAADLLPSEMELATRFNVNRHTIRRAVETLIDSGLVERRHGKGTVVLEPALNYAIGKHSRFTEQLSHQGKNTDCRLLRKLVIPASGGICHRLALKPGTPVIWLETLRSVEDSPFCLISHFVPQQGFEPLNGHYHGGSLHRFIKHNFNIDLIRSDSLITAIMPQGDDATQLNMPRQIPVLRVKSLNIDNQTRSPVEYAVTRFRSDRTQLAINL